MRALQPRIIKKPRVDPKPLRARAVREGTLYKLAQ